MQITLRKVIKLAGGTVKVAQACGVSPGAVSQWIKDGFLPLTEVQLKTHYSKQILELSGAEISEWDLRLLGRKKAA